MHRTRLVWPFAGCLCLLLLSARTGHASVSPRKGAHPVAMHYFTGEFAVIGGFVDGKWRSGEQIQGLVARGTAYGVYSFTKRICTAEERRRTYDETEGQLHLTLMPVQGAKVSMSSACVAVAGSRNALQRVPRVLKPSQEICRRIASSVLRSKGISNAKPHVVKAIEADLDGDGLRETVVEAQSADLDDYAEDLRVGSYSFVAVQKTVAGREKILLLGDGLFIAGKKDLQEIVAGFSLSINAVADLDGDGAMELVVGLDTVDDWRFDVYKLDASGARRLSLRYP